MPPPSLRRRGIAAAYGLLAHALFAAAVGAMGVGLFRGLTGGLGTLGGAGALAANTALALQFPVLHSLLLTRRGGTFLGRLAPAGLGPALATTTYAAVASLQLLATFLLWSPSGRVLWAPAGPLLWSWTGLYGGAWLFLLRALYDGGLALHTGYLGWSAAFGGQAPAFGPFPRRGLFRLCRQPIYVGFTLVLWAGPVWTPDRIHLAGLWTAYCLIGPRFKESRALRRHGEAFRRYRSEVPYWLPYPRRRKG